MSNGGSVSKVESTPLDERKKAQFVPSLIQTPEERNFLIGGLRLDRIRSMVYD
jgi:hypothetical protein